MIDRARHLQAIDAALRRSPVVSLLGPRQAGKTTLARAIAGTRKRVTLFDLENPSDVARLTAPMTALEELRGLVIIDEVQRMPELFAILRVLADRPRTPARFLILGSADPRIVRGVSESLAGRVAHVDIGGFDLTEVGAERVRRLWLRGGLPRSYLARSDASSLAWRRDYVRDFLQRDLAELGITIPAATLGRFWTMVAHYHGGLWNAAEFARSLGTSEPTARHYLDILSGAWAVRQLQPWSENLGKRLVRSPKVYIREPGLLHALLDLTTFDQLFAHPKVGASWEGFAIEQVLAVTGAHDAYFWATYQGAEIDLMIVRGGKRYGFEMKLADAPVLTKSIHIATADLRLERVFVISWGRTSYRLGDTAEVVSIHDLASRLRELT
ncbi:MAG: ATP-binding protein [Deltaproteobacteria bacterium]|nr:ATP-binding protein [Deltaproteobacteria bacterium]